MAGENGCWCALCGVLIALVVGGGLFYIYPSPPGESCDDDWINRDVSPELRLELNGKVHGQHLVIDPIVKYVTAHLANPQPQKALVLSFHGSTGIGKNFVSGIIADNIFKKGHRSKFVQYIIGPHHFPHPDLVEQYKQQLKSRIKTNTSSCGRSMFIIDEVDKMPPGLLDAIKPFVKHYPQVDGIDYRKVIFILIGNSGAGAVDHHTYEHRMKGGLREDLTMKEMENILHEAAFNESGGLQESGILEKNLVSAFIPFLPLEESHVKKCIRDDLENKGVHPFELDPEMINKVNQELTYWPKGLHIYSHTGCKRVSDKVDLLVYEHKFRSRTHGEL